MNLIKEKGKGISDTEINRKLKYMREYGGHGFTVFLLKTSDENLETNKYVPKGKVLLPIVTLGDHFPLVTFIFNGKEYKAKDVESMMVNRYKILSRYNDYITLEEEISILKNLAVDSFIYLLEIYGEKSVNKYLINRFIQDDMVYTRRDAIKHIITTVLKDSLGDDYYSVMEDILVNNDNLFTYYNILRGIVNLIKTIRLRYTKLRKIEER